VCVCVAVVAKEREAAGGGQEPISPPRPVREPLRLPLFVTYKFLINVGAQTIEPRACQRKVRRESPR
jgi:hypothetical protein